MNIVPKPCTAELFNLTYKLKQSGVAIDIESFDIYCTDAFLTRTGLSVNDSNDYDIRLVRNADLVAEEYDISVSDIGIKIQAATEVGIISAFASVIQLIDEDGNVGFCHIHDKPKHSYRGLSLDCVRHFFTAEEVKKVIEQISLAKMNALHWHLTDDQGWRIESKVYPKLHQQCGEEYYSQDEIKEIVRFASVRGVEIIPEIDMPGHTTSILSAYPELGCSGEHVQLAKYGGIYRKILCAGNEKTYNFLESLLDEIISLFSSDRFHIGGDEAPKFEWMKCPRCQKTIYDNNLHDEIELQGYFSNRVVEMLAKAGKQVICWNDSLEAANLSTSLIAQFWTIEHEENVAVYAKNGGKIIYSDMFDYYISEPHSMLPMKRLYNSKPIIDGVDYSGNETLLGIEVCLWAENISTPTQLEKKLFPRLYAAAEAAWSNNLDYDNFKQRLSVFLRRCHPANMAYIEEEGWDPEGKRRQEETFAHLIESSKMMPPEVREETVKNASLSKKFHEKYRASYFEAEDMEFLRQMSTGIDD